MEVMCSVEVLVETPPIPWPPPPLMSVLWLATREVSYRNVSEIAATDAKVPTLAK